MYSKIGRGAYVGTYIVRFLKKIFILTWFRIHLLDPLSATIDPQQQKVDSNQSAIFNCTVLGHPIKSVFWMKDGFKLSTNQKITIIDQSVLTIHAVNKKDQGMYQCVVKNEETSSQGTAQLLLGGTCSFCLFVESLSVCLCVCVFVCVWEGGGSFLPSFLHVYISSVYVP